MKLRFLAPTVFVFTGACGAVAPFGTNDAAPESGADVAAVDVASDASSPIEAGVPPLASMATPRSLFGAALGTDGLVRVFSGYSTLVVVSSVEAYDETQNTWTTGTPGPIQRYAHTVTEDASGNVYVIGGTSNGQTALASMQMYASKTDSWTTLPSMPTPRLGLGAAVAKDGRVFAIGGGLPGSPLDTVEIYTPETKTWATGPSVPTPRLSLQVVTGPDGLIYAMGGRDANTTPLTVVEALDPVKGTWATVQPLSTARYWFAATVAHDGRIFALGGIGDAGFTDSVEAFTVGSGWAPVASLPENRAWLAAAALPSGHVLAMGGATDTGVGQPPPLATMFSYDPAKDTWSK